MDGAAIASCLKAGADTTAALAVSPTTAAAAQAEAVDVKLQHAAANRVAVEDIHLRLVHGRLQVILLQLITAARPTAVAAAMQVVVVTQAAVPMVVVVAVTQAAGDTVAADTSKPSLT